MGARVPQHPVMICAPPGPPAVVRATGLSAFLFDASTTSRTLFKNLYVLLDATSGFQTGFWVGGNLPWYPIAASATFEDIYVRAPRPGVEYFGWLLYTSAEEPVTLSRCTVNAAGSEWVYGVQDFGTAPLSVENCSFVNFPSNLTGSSCGILTRSSSSAGGGAEVSVSRTVFDESFTNAIMIGRLEEGISNVISVADCIVPRELPPVFPLEFVSGVVVTNAALAWSGFPTPDSPSVALGMGALSPVTNDPTVDTDGDGLYDYNEVYVRSLDPYLADTDRDGVPDGVEVLDDGTDPTNPHSFLQHLYFSVTNTVSLSHAAYVAWGYSDIGWETNGLAEFPLGAGTNSYVDASANGAVFIKAFCDLDDDGEFNAATDILLVRPIPQGAVATINFMFGDVDGDGVTDAQELQDGTDPHDAKNYAVNLFGRFEGVFHTTNDLSVVVKMGTNTVYGPVVLADRTWMFGPQSIMATTGGRPTFLFWDDANSNGVFEASETSLPITPSPVTHDMAFTNRLSYGAFDGDNDEILDWWEVQHGLCQTNKADAVEDTDGDGLINLHEFWCDTEPLVPDGSNTLLSVMSRSIDDRIRDIDPATAVPLFIDYFTNGASGNFVANTNLWTRNLDLSCVNVWNNGPYPGSQPATLITRKHIVMAQHWYNESNEYAFCDSSGLVCGRSVVQKVNVFKDLLLGRLDSPLPDSFKPASVMSTNFVNFLSTGRYLPTLCVNQEKCATVLELENLNVETVDKWGRHYAQYGMNSHTNIVSSQRRAVRAVTYGGSSGCPVFAVVGDELILLFAKHLGYSNEETWSPFWGPMLSFQLEKIQRTINQWEGADASLYQLVPFDVGSYDEVVNR